MSLLSREIARWLQSNPGPLTAANQDEVWLLAKMKFMADRRWRQEFDMAVFMQHLNSLGYRIEQRACHENGKEEGGVWMLALPARHRGF